MRCLLIALVVSGCGFSIDTDGPLGGGDDEPSVQADANTTATRMCSTSDPSLRLCIDFDDAGTPVTDLLGHPLDAQNLTPMPRDSEMAVQLDATSRLHVAETMDLDIPDEVTVSMWISVDIGGLPLSTTNSRWLYDNNTQYFAQLRLGGIIRCGVGGEDADSGPIVADGRWHHVACVYKRDEIRVYVNGDLHDCEDTSDRPIPTNGDVGLAIGANVAGSATGPRFTEQFIGGIDNVQVFSRLLAPSELCDAAGGTQCRSSCPD